MEAFFKALLGIRPEHLQSGLSGRIFHGLGAVFATALGLAILFIQPAAADEADGIPFSSKLVFAGLMFGIALVLVRQAIQPDDTKK